LPVPYLSDPSLNTTNVSLPVTVANSSQRPNRPLSDVDLEHVFQLLVDDFAQICGARIFMTGGTGFFGTWLLETALHINQRCELGLNIVMLTRNPDRWAGSNPHLANDLAVTTVRGDVTEFSAASWPKNLGAFDYLIHAAYDSGKTPGIVSDVLTLNTLIDGTRNVLQFAEQSRIKRFLLVSSGAIYGPQSPGVLALQEDAHCGPNPLAKGAVYGEGKRAAETLTTVYGQASGFETVIARAFAFVGPHLPIDAHFAVGNFLRDLMLGQEIVVNGDGTPLRSYLYAADMAVWLWRILLRGQSGRAYNVGSGEAISISSLAHIIANLLPNPASVRIMKEPDPRVPTARYIPDVTRAAEELNLHVRISLQDSLSRTLSFLRK
jgi:nucleoside-diphosphate-sugar epimerase